MEKNLYAIVRAAKEEGIKREDAISYLPYASKEESIFISPEGLQQMMTDFDP